ncbi:MAG: hypothetical protein U0075_21275 [Thermomicrobiales bacterium]
MRVILCEANERVYRKLGRAGLLAGLAGDGYVETLVARFVAPRRGVEVACRGR